jgi:hypothetical protein
MQYVMYIMINLPLQQSILRDQAQSGFAGAHELADLRSKSCMNGEGILADQRAGATVVLIIGAIGVGVVIIVDVVPPLIAAFNA